MEITYKTDIVPKVDEIIEVYISSEITRPTADKERIAKMYANSNLVVTAWHGNKLVGVSRALTDFCYCCYLSDLAVSMVYQKRGIGKELVNLTKQVIGDETTLILLAAPAAINYYPKIGMDKIENGFIIRRLL
jgi:predicted N-acetyltransferase YhbS